MFPFITTTWNPLGGECLHNCSYCWAKKLAKTYNMQKYTGYPTLNTKEIYRTFKPSEFVFVCDMTDLFGAWVPSEMIQAILNIIWLSHAKFLLLTKNPARYHEFMLPPNCVAGATIETDLDYSYGDAPGRIDRIHAMQGLAHQRKMVSIEPIMMPGYDFTDYIIEIHPEFVAVGYDNYGNKLIEPDLEIVEEMIKQFESVGIKVYRKTIREPLTISGKQITEQ